LKSAAGDASTLTRTDEVEVVDVAGTSLLENVAVVESDHEVTKVLTDTFHLKPVALADVPASNRLDAIILSTKSMARQLRKSGDATNATPSRRNNTGPQILQDDFDAALARVKNDGTRLVLWPDNNQSADVFARALANRNIVKYDGVVGNLDAPWFGSWFFVRKHWLLDGLPADCAMDWRYGVSAFNGPAWLQNQPGGTRTDGLLLDAPGLEVVVGYGADHNTKVGTSGCVIPYGKGQIVIYCLPQLVRSLQPGNFAMSPVICQRLLANALEVAHQ
jgi:beta-galactosidase